ncbi:hypothetical protein LBMAG56_17390 [Verrucomicrobiota bacterium]|nr:hypothetical protein LBMAG56_17390 [Verrucomicrobiota bacterium]
MEGLALGADAAQLGAGAVETMIAILKDQKLFNDGKHVDLGASLQKRYAPVKLKSTHPRPAGAPPASPAGPAAGSRAVTSSEISSASR